MVSKNNFQQHQQAVADRVPHYGLRKLSIGVASVLLSTTLYMGVTAHADTTVSTSPQPTVDQPANTTTGTSTSDVTTDAQPTAGQPASTATPKNDVSAKSAPTALPKQPANATDAQPTADHSSRAANSPTPENDVNAKSAPTALPKQPANADTQSAATTSGVQPFVNLAVESDNNDLTPKKETVNSTWTLHYVNQADHQQELKDPTVITLQYARTNTPQSDGTTQYGDWSYVPGSFKQTGTPITVKDSDNPVKQDNIDKNGENFDVFTITAMYPTVAGYNFHDGINGTRLHDNVRNNERQADSMSKDFYAEYNVAKERSVAIKFVDDQSFNPGSSDGKTQVGQAVTVTGRDGDTVNLNLTVPDKYQLADGQQLPTTYTFAKGSGNVTIHLVHKVVQREAAIDVQLGLITLVRTRGDDGEDAVQEVVTQTRWKQPGDDAEHLNGFLGALSVVGVGTLTGHVNYDLVDERVVSLKDDWTSLNLSGHSYQLPNGTEIVNGIRVDADDTMGKKLRDDWYLNEYRKWHHDVDPDYITRPWHGYLSVNETNNEINSDYGIMSDVRELGLQAGLVGDEPNALAKAIGDRAATSVEMSNKPIDLNLLQGYDFDFSEKNGQLRAEALLPVAGAYIPYVEKTATRTINVTAPDGKTKTVKQTATLAKQVDFADDAHPAWTTSEWASYEVPTIPGYTASQSNVAKETVTGETEDQTVNITYTANPQTTTVIYQAEDGTPVHTTTVKGQTGQTVKVPTEVPVGWRIVNGKVPSEITFEPNGTPKTVVTIAHSHVIVAPDAPKTTSDKLPDNPGKSYPAGVSRDDLNKTVTRTIKVTTPDGQTKTVVQTAKLTRTADVDEVTGEVKYSDWTTGNWSAYTAPSVPGYTASQSNVAQQAVTDTTKDQTIDITYTANDHQISVEYVDNATGQVLKTDHVSGKTGQTVPITLHIPDGWELVSGQSVPSEVTLGTDGAPATVIKVQPQERSVAVKFFDDQFNDFGTIYQKQVGQAITLTGRDGDTVTLNLTVPDKYQLADGQQLPTTYTFKKGSGDVMIRLKHQIVQRKAAVDVQLVLVTSVPFDDNGVDDDQSVVTQAQWNQLDDELKSHVPGPQDILFPLVKVGTLVGHVDYDPVDDRVVSLQNDWTSLNLDGQTYQMPNGTEIVNGIVAGYTASFGKKLKSVILADDSDVDPDYVNRPWHGYLSVNTTNNSDDVVANAIRRVGLQVGLVGDEPNALTKATGDRAATGVEMSNKTIDSNSLQNYDPTFNEQENYDFNEQDGQLRADVHLPVFGVYIPYVEKTATRTINVTTPDGKTTTVKQTATLAKQVDFGKDAHAAWTTGEWTSYEVPTISGYTASQSSVAKETVTGTTKDQTVNITYTANPQTTHVNYVDDQGKLVHTATVNGQTNQTVDVPSEVPTGWKLVDGQTVPATITFGPDGHADTSVKIEHRHVTVTPDKPQNNGAKLPDNPEQSFHGVEASDLNKTVTRTIKVTTPDGQTNTIKQTVKLTRNATVDEVTGDVNYGDWSTGKWDAYTVPTVKGYTATRTEVAAIPVNDRTTDQTVNVTYTPDAQKLNVKFIDDTTGQVLKTVTKIGVTNADAGYNTQSDIQSYEGQHYVLVSDSSNGANLVFDHDDAVDQHYEVHLTHATHQIDEHHTITQTVHYTATDHAGVPDDHTVSVQFDHDGYHDEVTGDDHWNAWKQGGTQTFSAVPTPAKTGYTPDIETISAVTVKPTDPDQKMAVTYTPDTQKLDIVFIDDTTGKTLKTVAKSGPTNSNVGYNTKSDINSYEGQHYVLVSDSSNGTSLAFDDQTGIDQHYEVHLKHGTHQVSDRHIITETVHYKMADGTQAPEDHTANVQFDRTGSHDEVTGVDTWNAWTPSATQQFAAVPSPAVSGYTPDTDQVAAQTVGPDAKDTAVTVTYSPNVQIAHVKYVDDTDHKVLTQDDLNGRTGETSGYHTADRITEFKGQHYVLVSDNYPVDGMTFDNNDHVDQQYEVHLVHDTRTDEQDVNVPRTITYVYQSGQQAQPDHTDSLKFHETKVVDLVDGHTVSDAWTQAQDFETVTTPTIQGYTPDRASVSNIGITHGRPAITEKVTYNPDAQKAVVKYIDDTTGEQLSAKDLSGYSDESTGYTTKDAIDGYTAKRYVLVSDGTQGQTIAFDHDDSADQVYEVHFKHGTEPTSESRTKKIVVHYSYVDGLARTGKAADDQIATDLTFSRTGTHDLVTDHIAWNAWDKSSQTFDAINSPAIQGYTPDRTVVDNVKVSPDSHDLTEVTVTYNADSQKLSVDFIDDTTGKTLKTINKTGYSDENAGYNTKSDIQDFISKHYDLVSDQTNGENLVFDHDDKTDQHYEVHLTHHLTPITDSREVNKTIHYQYADGAARNGKAADDYNAQALNFSRTGNHDDVTGIDHWNAWTPASQNFDEVQSPVIAGYTPDKSVIDQQAVNAESPNIDLTVTYAPDAQKLDVVYIDDTEGGKVLKTVTKNGVSDEAAGYNTKSDINALEGLHYNVVSDSTNGANLVFDHDDATDQHYEVHLTHATKPISEAKSTNETIRYQLADGTKAFDDYTAKVNFSRTGFNDLVTNIDHWNDWTPAVEQNFNAVQSPVKQGYTPDHAQIDAIAVHPGDADTARTVIYSPDAQTVTIDYLDDVTGKTLQTKTITGVSDVDTGYTTAETINNYEGQHYKLVSDNTDGDQLVFDHDDTTDQHYEVHLTHTYKSVNDSATVNEAIHYQYTDGTQAKPDHKAEALNFSRTGTQDLVDNSIAWNAWTPDQQTFVGVDTPAIGGYTPDIETVAPVTVSHNTPDVERTVIYHADDQTILVHYIDDDTQSTLKTDSTIGKTSQKSGYKTGKTIDGYKQAGYDLVSDDTNGDELVFDNDSTKAQVYNVHLKHRHQAASDSDTVKQTVHYVYNDGSKAADDYTATPIEFTRTGDTDLVTGKTTWNAWTPTSQTFKAVPSPVIAGYTPGRATIDHIDVHAGDPDIDETVTYVPDAQRIVVNYIDSVTHQTLKTDTLDGHSDQSTNYNTQKNIDGYKNQHYTLVSDDTQGQNLVFDHDDQATQVYNVVLSHETETVHRAHTVSETIDYKYADGTEAAPTKTAEPKTFSQSGVHDLVTNTTDWNGQWTAPQTFNAVESPKITGFTPDYAVTEAVTVDHDSQDVYKLVVYTANKQAAKINYIDDVTGETLETDTAAGHFGEQISFGRDVNDQIKQFENQGYKLVSNNFNGQKYQADDSNNVFEVHLTHQHQAVSEPDTVTETVKYQYADGTQAAKDSTQSAEFTRTGDKDLVTGTIVWMPSTETHQFDAVDSPAIDGFTPDVQSVPAATVKFGDKDITKVVTYTANDQNAGIKIIDDTTGDVLNTQTATGKFGQTIEFKTDPDTQVADLYGQGYELVSDNFSHQKYQSDNTKNQFEIHVRHQTVPATRTSTVIETVHYRDRNGNRLVPDTHQTKTFTETGVTDKVTGKTTWNATGTQTFNTVKVPTVTGYTPDRTEVPSADVRFGDHDIDEAVIYTPDSETAQIKYIDDVTGEVLLTDNMTGDYGSTIEFDHNPSSQINQYESQGYKLVSNSYGDQTHQFSATPSDNQFEVHLTHQTKDVSRTKTVTRTINYVDAQTGNKLRPSDKQTLTFTEHGTMDLVTGKTTWVTAPVQHFAKVAVPDIDGYTHQMQTVDSQTADFDSDDFEVTVPYTKVQTPNVPDTGTPTGGQSTPGTVTPTGGEDIPTGTQTINGQRQVISTADEPQHQPVQNNSQAQTLPQTGNSEQNGTALAGLGLIGMVGSLFGFKKKRD